MFLLFLLLPLYLLCFSLLSLCRTRFLVICFSIFSLSFLFSYNNIGGVGFDIGCGVRLLRTRLRAADVASASVREQLATALNALVPTGVGSQTATVDRFDADDLQRVLATGMDFLTQRGLAWPEDQQCVEDRGAMANADPRAVSERAFKRGLLQVGSLGSGNHYVEVQLVSKIFDAEACAAMGLVLDQVVVMIHSGSRGLGHQVRRSCRCGVALQLLSCCFLRSVCPLLCLFLYL